MPFEPENAPFLTGTIAASVIDATGIAPPVVISGDATAEVNWSIDGLLVPPLDEDVQFLVSVFLERIGPGTDLEFTAAAVLLGSVPLVGNSRSYSVSIPIPNASVPDGGYTVTAVLTSLNPDASAGSMAAFEELGMRQWKA